MSDATTRGPRRAMLSEPNPVTGARLILRPVSTLDPYAGRGWDLITIGAVTR